MYSAHGYKHFNSNNIFNLQWFQRCNLLLIADKGINWMLDDYNAQNWTLCCVSMVIESYQTVYSKYLNECCMCFKAFVGSLFCFVFDRKTWNPSVSLNRLNTIATKPMIVVIYQIEAYLSYARTLFHSPLTMYHSLSLSRSLSNLSALLISPKFFGKQTSELNKMFVFCEWCI